MKPIRIGVIFDQKIHAGGAFQQALNAALLAKNLSTDLVEVFFFTIFEENTVFLFNHKIKAEYINLSLVDKIEAYIRSKFTNKYIVHFIQKISKYSALEKSLFAHRIDLVYFLSPSGWAKTLEKLNYITTVWDLCHRDDPEFPEVRWNRQFEIREENYCAILPRAIAIFVDSDLSKSNVSCRYGIDMDRIHIMPFQAAVTTRCEVRKESKKLSIATKYQMNSPYVFYPAQFWAHKNHIYILEGLLSLEKFYGIRVGAIFSGGDQGNKIYIEDCVRKMGLENRVRLVGFVDNEEIVELYRQSVALVMPSYFGPTNLPPLEAFNLGVPVLYSNKAGLRDQVGDAALLMDLGDPKSMALHIKNLIDNIQLREELITNGYKMLDKYDACDRLAILQKVINDFQFKRQCWD